MSTFPGIDLLGHAFSGEGFCIASGPDYIYGGDVRDYHPPAGRFDGVIGGPPCQAFSSLRHLVEANGHKPKFGNLIPEFERVVFEAQPDWFLMENVRAAPIPKVEGYKTWSCLLNNRPLGEKQNRLRRWSYGARKRTVLMIDTVALEHIEFEYAACGGMSSRPVAIGGSGKPKKFRDGKSDKPWNVRSRAAFSEICRKQRLPEDFDIPAFTVEAKCKAVGNGVPLAMGRALARAVKEAIADFEVANKQ